MVLSPVLTNWPHRRPPKRWQVQVLVALLLVGGLFGLRRELPSNAPALRAAAAVVRTWAWPPPSSLQNAARFIGQRSWGTLLDVWTKVLPRGVTPVPDGRVVLAYGWHAVGKGFQFEPGVRVKGPVGGPVLASAAGIVARSGGTVWVVVSPAVRVGYVGLSRVAVPPGAHAAPGEVLGQSPGVLTVVVWEHGYPVNPADTPYLGALGGR